VIAAQIVEDLTAALDAFSAVSAELSSNGDPGDEAEASGVHALLDA
jgi:hypothetical protein